MKWTLPNQLTILRIILTPVFIYFFFRESMQDRLVGTVIFLLAASTDWYDGYFARRFNLITRWGQFMDPLADKILTMAALFIFAALHYIYWWMVILMIGRDFMITFLRIFALKLGKSIVTSYLAKVKTTLEMIAILILLVYLNFPQADIYHLSSYPPPYTHWISLIFAGVTFLTVFSGVQYLIENWSHVQEIYNRTLRLLGR
jgi:CDP-diacylglycerol---glycerol-3-phosphate 3-phosphatidyltransferase